MYRSLRCMISYSPRQRKLSDTLADRGTDESSPGYYVPQVVHEIEVMADGEWYVCIA